jgi:serine/threonine protein kinase
LEEADHPSILRYYDQGTYDQYPFLVSEYFPRNLREKIDQEAMSLTTKLSYAVQLLSVLTYLEERSPPVIHRDIKPENIFVRGETCFLGDFGLMKRKGSESDGEVNSFYQSEDIAMNKYQYRTPDLVKYEKGELEHVPINSDVFQLGLVLIELFTENNWNPQRASNEPLSDIDIDPRAYDYIRIPEGMGDGIGNLLTEMIAKDHSERPKASDAMDSWMYIFEEAAEMSQDLNGRVFP